MTFLTEKKYRVVCLRSNRSPSYHGADLRAVAVIFDELNFGRPLRVARYDFRLAVQRDLRPGHSADFSWQLVIVVPAVTFLAAFVKGFGDRLGNKSADAAGNVFHEWLRRMRQQEEFKRADIYVLDKKKDLLIHIPHDMPPEGYYELQKTLSEKWPELDRVMPHSYEQLTLDDMPEPACEKVVHPELYYVPGTGWVLRKKRSKWRRGMIRRYKWYSGIY